MAGYSATPLSKKLGIKPEQKIFFKNAPEGYLELLGPLPAPLTIAQRICDELDLIHFFTLSQAELRREIPRLVKRIKQNGCIWISWPKKASKVRTDMSENVIREVVLPMGLVDIKVCAVDEVWSALKVVIRKENRI